MTLSRYASVSKQGLLSFGQLQFDKVPLSGGQVLLDQIFGGAEPRRDFASRIPAEAARELESLASESNPQIFFPDLVNLALRLEQAGKAESAAQLLLSIAENLQDGPEDLIPVRDKALRQIQAMQGKGEFGSHAEILLQKFCKEATDPAALIAMGVGTQMFRLGRLWSATRFSSAGLIPEATALGCGFMAETSAFTLSHKLVSSALDRPQNWDPNSVSREWAAGALVLGPLKIFGAAGHLGVRGTLGSSPLARLSQVGGLDRLAASALPNLAIYGGIVFGHQLQENFGLREKAGAAAGFVDGLSTFFQLKAGGGLFAAAAGRGYRRGLAESELRLQNWRNQGGNPQDPMTLALLPHPQGALAETHYRDPIKGPTVLRMDGQDGESKPSTKLWTGEEMSQAINFLVGLPLPAKQALTDIFHGETGQLKMGATLRRHSLTDPKALEQALCRLGYAIKHARAGKAEGGYFDWLLRTVFEDIVEKSDSVRADRILHFLHEGGTLRDFEKMVAEDMPDLGFNRFAAWLPEHWKVKNPHYATIQAMPLPQDLRNILFRFSYTQANSKQKSPYFQSETDLFKAIYAHQWNRMGLIRGVLEGAAQSPLGILRLRRLTQVLTDPQRLEDFVDLKLFEMMDSDFYLRGAKQAELPHSRFRTPPSQFNGYLGEEAPNALLHEIQKRQTELLDPKRAALRAQRRKEHLKLMENHHGRLRGMDRQILATAFQLLGDPYSKKIAKSLTNNEFDLRVLPDAEYEAECRLHSARLEPEHSSAQFFPAGHGRARGIMLIRERSFDHYSSEVVPDALFTVMGKISHEYQHFLDMHPEILDTARNRLLVEMSAHLRDALWKAEHGDTGKLINYTRDGVAGLALHFRNEFEQIYGGIFKTDTSK